MKKLVTAKIVKDFANQNRGKDFIFDDNTLITPSARDMANSLGIKLTCVESQLAQLDQNENEELSSTVDAANATKKETKESKHNNKVEANYIDYDKKQIVEMVIKVLSEKGLLDKILD